MKIVVYDDSLDFGGHQIMACRGIEALASDPALEVIALCPAENRRLHDRLAAVPRVRIIAIPGSTARLPGLYRHLKSDRIKERAQQLAALQADQVLCIQGDIEQSAYGVIAARLADIHCISYLAIPHRFADMQAKLGKLRDRINRHLLNQPDRYITVAQSMKEILHNRGVYKPVSVVPNGIPMPRKTSSPKPQAPNSSPVLGLIGRIEFKQKHQDFMVDTFCTHADAFRDCQLLIAGDGPDARRLKTLVSNCSRSGDINIEPWLDDTDSLWSRIDFLMLPSRYEGMPLVMLEALARGIPVIASNCDGMKEVLPSTWRFEPGNADQLAAIFVDVHHIRPTEIGRLQENVRTNMTIETFQTAFRQAVCAPFSENLP